MVEIRKTTTTSRNINNTHENGSANPETVPAANSSWWKRALASAIRGGTAGSVAMILQVVLLMWLRTTVNYQYKHGVDVATAFSALYEAGGVLRFYRGASFALLTGPISRFGDTAANEGIRELFRHNLRIPLWAVTFLASLVAASWRIVITPLDTVKTTLQVYGSTQGWERLSSKAKTYGIRVLWDGALGNSVATLAGHYPWFVVNNWLEQLLPKPTKTKNTTKDDGNDDDDDDRRYQRQILIRRAFIGFCSSVVSDCVSNGIRVVKTYRQTAEVPLSYGEALSELMSLADQHQAGFAFPLSFVTRGLGLKVVSNGLSGILFSVLWKMILERMHPAAATASATAAADKKSK